MARNKGKEAEEGEKRGVLQTNNMAKVEFTHTRKRGSFTFTV